MFQNRADPSAPQQFMGVHVVGEHRFRGRETTPSLSRRESDQVNRIVESAYYPERFNGLGSILTWPRRDIDPDNRTVEFERFIGKPLGFSRSVSQFKLFDMVAKKAMLHETVFSTYAHIKYMFRKLEKMTADFVNDTGPDRNSREWTNTYGAPVTAQDKYTCEAAMIVNMLLEIARAMRATAVLCHIDSDGLDSTTRDSLNTAVTRFMGRLYGYMNTNYKCTPYRLYDHPRSVFEDTRVSAATEYYETCKNCLRNAPRATDVEDYPYNRIATVAVPCGHASLCQKCTVDILYNGHNVCWECFDWVRQYIPYIPRSMPPPATDTIADPCATRPVPPASVSVNPEGTTSSETVSDPGSVQ